MSKSKKLFLIICLVLVAIIMVRVSRFFIKKPAKTETSVPVKITKPVINPVLEITTPALWKSVDAIGNKVGFFAGNCGKGEPMQGIPVWFGGPSMRLRNITMR